MIPILYEKTETEFTSNGLGRLRDAIKVEVTEERNGVYECDFEYPVNGTNYEDIEVGRIIAVEHDTSGDIQPFDIVSCTKPISGRVTFHAVHISYRQRKMVTSGTSITSLADAFSMLRRATPSNPFEYETDKNSVGYLASADGTPLTVREFLGGVDGSILDTYYGEFEWNKFKVILHNERGVRTAYTIRYGVNLVSYEEEIDESETYNAVVPYWKGQNAQSQDIVIVGSIQRSGMTISSGRVECIPLDVTNKFETQPTKEEVQAMGLQIMSETQPYLPVRNIKIDFAQLTDSSEYAEYADLLKCNLCDTIRVVFPCYNMDGYFKIVKVTYDVLQERYTSMELGTLSTTLSEALGIGSGISGGGSSGGGGGGGSAIVYRLTKNGNTITLTGGDTSSSVTDSDTKYGLSINGHTVALVAGGSDSSVTVPDNFTTEYETKLNGIEAGAEVNVQSDWNASSGDAQILNKPSIPTKTSELTNDMIYDLGTVSRGQFTITEAQRTAVATMWAKGLCAVTLTNDSEKFYAIKERTVTYSGLDFYGFVGSYAGLSATGTPQTGICIVGICTTQNIGIFGAVDDIDQDDVETIISSYLPTAVTVTQKTTSGTNIADITIGGTTTRLYAPTGGGGGITVLDCYPVGSYYETSDSSFDPNTAWGGTWVLDSKGRVTVGRDETIADFNTVGKTGGEKTHTLTVDEMPSHTHKDGTNASVAYVGHAGANTAQVAFDANSGRPTTATGGGQAHNNMPPYVVVNRWHRTA